MGIDSSLLRLNIATTATKNKDMIDQSAAT